MRKVDRGVVLRTTDLHGTTLRTEVKLSSSCRHLPRRISVEIVLPLTELILALRPKGVDVTRPLREFPARLPGAIRQKLPSGRRRDILDGCRRVDILSAAVMGGVLPCNACVPR